MADNFQFTLDVAGEEQLVRGFSRLADEFKDLSEPFRAIVQDFKAIEAKQFKSEGSYGGSGWQALSPRYAAWKEQNYPGRPIMVLSGLLMDSLTGENSYFVQEIRPLQLTMGTQVPWAIYHQQGTSRMPQRKLVNLTEADRARMMKTIHTWMVRSIDQQFAGLMPDIGAAQSHLKSI